MRNPIKQSNEWYDNLPSLKRDLFFLVFVLGSLIVSQFLTYAKDCIWAFPIWATTWTLWRVPYMLIQSKK